MAGNSKSGRKAKPKEAKKLEGTYREDRDNLDAPEFEPFTEPPKSPTYITGKAQVAWTKHAALLTEAGVLTPSDLHALEAYCVTYSQWRDAVAELSKKNGMIQIVGKKDEEYEKPSAYITIAKDAQAAMRQWMNELGITPSSRSKVSGSKKAKEDANDLSKFFEFPGKN